MADAAYGDQLADGKCRLGYVIGLMSPTLSGLRHTLHWTSKFARNLVKRSHFGDAYALSEMIGHMSLQREFYEPLVDLFPRVIDF